MEEMLYDPPFLLYFVLFLILLVTYWWKRSTARVVKLRLPPGPRKLPLIGNLHQLASGSLPPHHTLRDLAKKYGPIMQLQLGEGLAIVISSPETTREVCKTHDLEFSQRPVSLAFQVTSFNNSSIAFCPYGTYWRQMRKICVTELLSTTRVHSNRTIREEEVWSLVQSISSSHCHTKMNQLPINLSHQISILTNNITARTVFGSQCKDRDEFISSVKQVFVLAGGFDLPDLFPSLKFLNFLTGMKPALEKLHKRVDKILGNIIDEHRLKRSANNMYRSRNYTNHDKPIFDHHEDLIDVLIKLQDSCDLEFKMVDDNIKGIAQDMFAGGTETTATVMEWAISELVKNPRVMEKAQAEIRQALEGKKKIYEADTQDLVYLKSIIKETLRLHPPGALHVRQSRERCEVSGYEIPKGAKVFINAWAIGRDSEYWVDPDKFWPERFEGSSIDFRGTDYEFIPFGSGRRICPGISFATAIVELALVHLLYHFDWKLPNGINSEELDMTEAIGFVSSRKHNLLVIPTPCIPFVDE
ncbi:Cytochrome P450 [Quillaja saponaria]|uniref:Cytochrome P450 n=1 Tax=Quillaja saponaria TaxID=32244 RepID=A0AAD7PWD7_QUISA|nr:Cytochrome P450 [Quillaja saponaria]